MAPPYLTLSAIRSVPPAAVLVAALLLLLVLAAGARGASGASKMVVASPTVVGGWAGAPLGVGAAGGVAFGEAAPGEVLAAQLRAAGWRLLGREGDEASRRQLAVLGIGFGGGLAVDCAAPGVVCGVDVYPTWARGGERRAGVQQLETLRAMAGVA